MRIVVLAAVFVAIAPCAPTRAVVGPAPGGGGDTDSTGTSDPTDTDSTGAPDPTDTAVGGAQHPSCAAPPPDPLPALPADITWDDAGRPRFAGWEDISCEDVPRDATAAGCEGQVLDGICFFPNADIWCDGEGEVIGWRDGECWLCGTPQAHASACCEGTGTVDCRIWPYPSDGVIGSPCARHADCEAGLVCGDSRGSGYGICQCAGEAAAYDVSPPDSCFR